MVVNLFYKKNKLQEISHLPLLLLQEIFQRVKNLIIKIYGLKDQAQETLKPLI